MNSQSHDLIILKDAFWLERQKIAGQCVAGILKTLNKMVVEKTPNISLKDMEVEAIQQLKAANCTATFKDYKGFPGAVCLSVNRQLVHGIPTNYILQEGDVVKFDLGATYNGAIADAAITSIYGKPKSNTHVELIKMCNNALYEAIKSIKIGKQLGCIGYAIHRYVTSKTNFGLVTNYGGHGINENQPHASPFVANKSKSNEGIRIQAGLTIAIEPMLTIGSPQTSLSKDGWTVLTEGINCHVEHTIFVHNDSVEIITWRDDEKDICSNILFFDKE